MEMGPLRDRTGDDEDVGDAGLRLCSRIRGDFTLRFYMSLHSYTLSEVGPRSEARHSTSDFKHMLASVDMALRGVQDVHHHKVKE